MDDQYLDIALDHIRANRCVLFLGPCFGLDANGKKLHRHLRAFLQAEKKPGSDQPKFELVDEFDNLFVFRDLKTGKFTKDLMHRRMQDFYRQEVQPNALYRRVARIPFSVVLTCTHDLLLEEAFRQEEIPVSFQHYNQEKTPEDHLDEMLPMLYNVFGNVADKNTVIDTYDGFSSFIINVLGGDTQLSINLKNALAEASMFLLLGFDLEAWYYPLVLRKLRSLAGETMHLKQEVSAYVGLDASGGPSARSDFQPDHRLAAMLNPVIVERAERMYAPIELSFWERETDVVLNAIFTRLEVENHLRQKPTIAARLRLLLKKGSFENVFTMLEQAFTENLPTESSSVVQLKSQFELYQKDRNLNLLTPDEERTGLEKIRQAIIYLIDRLEKLM